MAYQLMIDEKLNPEYRGEATYFSYNIHVDLPDQFLAGYIATHIVNAHVQELANAGSDLLHLKLFEDKLSGTWSTNFKVEVWASGYAPDPDSGISAFGNGVSGRIGVIPWAVAIPLIIEAVIALIIVVGVVWSIIEIKHIVNYLGPVGGTAFAIAAAGIVGLVVYGLFRK